MNILFILVGLAGLVLIVLGAAVGISIWTNRKLRGDPDFATLQERRPEGYWMGIGMAIGVAIGISVALPIGIALDNSAFAGMGPAMGAGMGVAIGAGLEQRHKGEIRPLTSYEKRARRWMAYGTIALLVALAATGAVALLGIQLR